MSSRMAAASRASLCAFFFCLALPVEARTGQAVVRLTTHELPPYSYRDTTQQRLAGIAVEAVDCVMRRMGQPFEVQVLPWARAQKMVQLGEADGFFAASRNSERDSYAVKSAIIAPQQWRWYLLVGNPADPLSPVFREKAQVGSFVGANMLDWLREHGYRAVATPPTTEGLLKMLRAGRVDAILANNLVMERLIQEQGLDGQLRSVLQEDRPLGVYFSKPFLARHPGFLERFNAQVGACRSTAR